MSTTGVMMGIAAGKFLGQMITGGGLGLLGGVSALGKMGGISSTLGKMGGSGIFGGSFGGRGGVFGGRGGGRSGGFGGGGRGGNFGGAEGENNFDGIKDLFSSLGRAKRPAFELTQSIPGRRRYYAAALVDNTGLADLLKEKLPTLEAIDEVKINTVTGSLLVLYHGEEEFMDKFMQQLAEKIFSTAKRPGPALVTTVSDGLAAVGQSIRRNVAEISRKVKEATNGWFDLPSMISLGFIVRGVQKLLLTPELPGGSQLLWWAFSLLRGWRGE